MKNKDIKSMQLINGVYLISYIKDIDSDSLELINPFVAHMTQKISPNGIIEGLSLYPWLYSLSKTTKVLIKKSHIIGLIDANFEIIRYYKHSIKFLKSKEFKGKIELNETNHNPNYFPSGQSGTFH